MTSYSDMETYGKLKEFWTRIMLYYAHERGMQMKRRTPSLATFMHTFRYSCKSCSIIYFSFLADEYDILC